MPPSFRHGSGVRVYVNDVNFGGILNDSEVDSSVDKAETSVYGNTYKSYMVGLEDNTVRYKGLYDGSYSTAAFSKNRIHEIVQGAVASSSPATNTYMPEGDVIGRRARLFQGVDTQFNIKSPQSDVVSVEMEQAVFSDMTAGEVLKDAVTPVSVAATFAVVDGVQKSTNGGAVHAHIIGWTATGTWTFKVQHSSLSGGAYTDLISAQTLNSATRYTRVAFTGQCKRYVKAVVTAKSGGNPSLNIAYGRNY